MVIPIQKNGSSCNDDICNIESPILNKPNSFVSELRYLRNVIKKLVAARTKENFNELSKILNVLGEVANEYDKSITDRSKLIAMLNEITDDKEE